jgi:glycosyltransferase involved in cell wall biosynthesis
MVRPADPAAPHLLVDARPLTGARNGITRFVEQLITAWPKSPGFRTTLISNRPILSNAHVPESVDCLQDNHPLARLPGTIWMTLRVPTLARRLGATHFLGTQHVLPLWRTAGLHQGVIVHDLVFELFPETMARSNRALTGYFAPRSIRRADHIFCVSNTTRTDLQRHFGPAGALVCYPGRTSMPWGSTSQRSQGKAGAWTIGLLVVGSIEPRKNLARLLKAFLLAADLEPGLTLDLVSGDGWGNVLGEATWERLLLHPRIRIHRQISDEALMALYRQADYLVLPSLYEGFGLPILEAVGNCAIIANDIPVFRELAGLVDGMRLMDLEADVSTIAAGLAALTNNAPLAPADDRGGFSWESSASCMLVALGLLRNDPRTAKERASMSNTLPFIV